MCFNYKSLLLLINAQLFGTTDGSLRFQWTFPWYWYHCRISQHQALIIRITRKCNYQWRALYLHFTKKHLKPVLIYTLMLKRVCNRQILYIFMDMYPHCWMIFPTQTHWNKMLKRKLSQACKQNYWSSKYVNELLTGWWNDSLWQT